MRALDDPLDLVTGCEPSPFGGGAGGADPAQVPVVYVAGWGRSGSTLLAYILAELPGFVPVGEVRYLWNALADGELCGCGEPVASCPFWSEVGRRGFGGWEHADVAEMVELEDELFARPRVALLGAPWLSRSYRRALHRYVEHLERLYPAIQAAAGGRVVVDSTKDPPYAFSLRHVRQLRLLIVHLVRDSRAAAFAWAKDVKRPEITQRNAYFPKYGPLHSAVLWLGGNLVLHPLRRQLMRYEALATAPRQQIENLLETLQLDPAAYDLSALERREVRLGGQHTIRGNPIRFQSGSKRIRIDDQWRAEMPARRRALITLLTWPLLVYYGYIHPGGPF